MYFGQDRNKNTRILRRVTNQSSKRRPVPFDCLVKVRANKSHKRKKWSKLHYDARLKFPRGVESSKLILRSGLYFLNDKLKSEGSHRRNLDSPDRSGSNDEENGVFVWNPSRKPILPILGVAMAIGNFSKLRHRILIFSRKRRKLVSKTPENSEEDPADSDKQTVNTVEENDN